MTTDSFPVERVYPPKLMIWIANPMLKRVLRRPDSGPSKGLMLLRVRGRRSGRLIETPVARQDVDGQLCCLTNSNWRHNFRGGHAAELYLDGRPRRVHGELVTDVNAVVNAYRQVMDRLGPKNYRRAGLRVNVKREPTSSELADAVGRYGLSYVKFTLLD